MMVVFDLDGTIANIDHRAHYVRDGNKQWDEFFEACDKDLPEKEVIRTLAALWDAGHRIEIWSGRSDKVRAKTEAWLNANFPALYTWDNQVVQPASLLTRMRPAKDYQSDVELKRSWLHEAEVKPDMIFDDRQGVVDMWREEGIKVAQVAPGDFDKPKGPSRVRKPKLTVMIGPSGAGKSAAVSEMIVRYAYGRGETLNVVSTDTIRKQLFGDNVSDDAYTPSGFAATFAAYHGVIKGYLDAGLDVIADATHIKASNRKALLEAVGADDGSVNVEYIVIDRPLEEKLASYNDNPAWQTNPDVIEKHHKTFQSSKKYALEGDGFDFVNVIDWSK